MRATSIQRAPASSPTHRPARLLAVLANGAPVAALGTAHAGPNITVQATPAQAGKATGAILTTPYLSVRALRRCPSPAQLKKDPRLPCWLDM